MNTDVLSIAGALKRHAGPVALIVIELSALMAVLYNVLFLVSDYARITTTPTGVNEADIAYVQRIGVVGADSTGGFDFGNFKEALRPLESVPGVTAAAYGGVPFFGANPTPIFLTPGQRSPSGTAYEFFGSQGLDRVLGIQLLAGHIPSDAELPQVDHLQPGFQAPILVTQALAQHLFPGDSHVVGKLIFAPVVGVGIVPARITGIVSDLRGTLTGAPEDDYSFLLEAYFNQNTMGGVYVIRAQPGQAQAALESARVALARHDRGGSVIGRSGTMKELRDQHLADAVSNVWTLVIVLGILSLIAVCGLTALTSFWVQRRRLHIGIRRALGATRGNILHYFQVENALIVGAGVCIGTLLALALNAALVRLYAMPALPLMYLGIAGALLLFFGQVAALAPALRAAAIPPSTALRTTY